MTTIRPALAAISIALSTCVVAGAQKPAAATVVHRIWAGPSATARQRALFFELADGTTCRPIAGPAREIEGLVELYTCKFGADGGADAVLGDLDASQVVWTIRKVLINKKTEPQTIKSFAMTPVKTVWE